MTTQTHRARLDGAGELRVLVWIGTVLLSVCAFSGAIRLVHWLSLNSIWLEVASYLIGFALGPIAFVYLLLMFVSNGWEALALFLRWTPCCPSAGSDGGIALV